MRNRLKSRQPPPLLRKDELTEPPNGLKVKVPTGFIYIVETVRRDYQQSSPRDVPTIRDGTIYFGPCKVPIRRKMDEGDYLFGISSSKSSPRRIVYTAKVLKKMTFADAYRQFPKLRGPDGPIHVRPVSEPLARFPERCYAHIAGSIHADRWCNDLRTQDLDAFFVCEPQEACVGRWLGRLGPIIGGEILEFLRLCAVYGNTGRLSGSNLAATERKPIGYGGLYTGLHLETTQPTELVKLVCRGIVSMPNAEAAHSQFRKVTQSSTSTCGRRRRVVRRGCR